MSEPKWSDVTMQIINRMTLEIIGKAFDPDWFNLRQRFEEVDTLQSRIQQLEGEVSVLKASLSGARFDTMMAEQEREKALAVIEKAKVALESCHRWEVCGGTRESYSFDPVDVTKALAAIAAPERGKS